MELTLIGLFCSWGYALFDSHKRDHSNRSSYWRDKKLLEFNRQSLRSFRQHLTAALDKLQKEDMADAAGHPKDRADKNHSKLTDDMQPVQSQDSRCVRVAWALRQVEFLAYLFRSRQCALPPFVTYVLQTLCPGVGRL